mgnify:CR=1 FL=1
MGISSLLQTSLLYFRYIGIVLKQLTYLIILFFVLISCNGPTDRSSLEEKVIQSMQASNQSNGNGDIKIKQLDLSPVGNNNYSGLLYTGEDGNQFIYEVEVNIIGDEFEWQILTTGELINSDYDKPS